MRQHLVGSGNLDFTLGVARLFAARGGSATDKRLSVVLAEAWASD